MKDNAVESTEPGEAYTAIIDSSATAVSAVPATSAVTGTNTDNRVTGVICFVSAVTFSRFINVGGNFVAMVMFSQISENSLAAGALIGVSQSLLITTTITSLTSVADATSRANGAENNQEVELIFKNGVVLGLILAVPATTLALTGSFIFKAILSKSPEETAIVQSYFNGYFWGIPATFLLSVQQNLAIGTMNPLPLNVVTFVNSGLMVGLSYAAYSVSEDPTVDVSGLFGHAVSLSAWLSLIGFTIYLKCSSRFKDFSLALSCNAIRCDKLTELIKLGLPTGIQIGSELLSVMVATGVIAEMSKEDLAANQIATQYLLLTIIPIVGISIGCDVLVGQSMGRRAFSDARKFGKNCILAGMGISTLALVLVVSIPKQLMSPFLDTGDENNARIIDTTRTFFIYNGVGQILDAARNISAAAIKGAFEETCLATTVGLLSMCAFALPVGYGLSGAMGTAGLYLARDIGMGAGAAILLSRWYLKIKALNQSNNGVRAPTPSTPVTESGGRNSFLSYFAAKTKRDASFTALVNPLDTTLVNPPATTIPVSPRRLSQG